MKHLISTAVVYCISASIVQSFQPNGSYSIFRRNIRVPLKFSNPIQAIVQPSLEKHRDKNGLHTTEMKTTILQSSSDIHIDSISEDDEASFIEASKFMLESFWVPISTDKPSPQISQNTYSRLTNTILDEFITRYGEIMGRRQLNSRLLSASCTENGTASLVGICGVDVLLIDSSKKVQYTRTDAETTLKQAVGSLGPKERREFKNSSPSEIVDALLPSLEVVAILSNLAVDPSRRRMGIGKKLCEAVEEIVKEEWKLSKIYLRVEGENEAARRLYESSLGFKSAWIEDGITLRADLEDGVFEEKTCEMVSLIKEL